jgi:hypothetical protein
MIKSHLLVDVPRGSANRHSQFVGAHGGEFGEVPLIRKNQQLAGLSASIRGSFSDRRMLGWAGGSNLRVVESESKRWTTHWGSRGRVGRNRSATFYGGDTVAIQPKMKAAQNGGFQKPRKKEAYLVAGTGFEPVTFRF